MRREFTTRKRAILAAVISLLAADVALAFYSWRLASGPRMLDREFSREEIQLKVLQGAIIRAQKIKDEMPKTQLDCQKFESSLLPASTGQSSVYAELDSIARKNGIRLEDLTFKATPIPERGLTELAMDSTIGGDYRNVVQFLNGLQRSANIYEVESLTLAAGGSNQGPANAIKVGLHLKTYFRAGA